MDTASYPASHMSSLSFDQSNEVPRS
jgi:hypothetical protein